MKSKLKFDIDSDNSVMITATVSHSEDVRDTLAKKFIEGFEGSGNLATIFFYPSEKDSDRTLHIYSNSGTIEGCRNLIRYSADYILTNLIEVCKEELYKREEQRKLDQPPKQW